MNWLFLMLFLLLGVSNYTLSMKPMEPTKFQPKPPELKLPSEEQAKVPQKPQELPFQQPPAPLVVPTLETKGEPEPRLETKAEVKPLTPAEENLRKILQKRESIELKEKGKSAYKEMEDLTPQALKATQPIPEKPATLSERLKSKWENLIYKLQRAFIPDVARKKIEAKKGEIQKKYEELQKDLITLNELVVEKSSLRVAMRDELKNALDSKFKDIILPKDPDPATIEKVRERLLDLDITKERGFTDEVLKKYINERYFDAKAADYKQKHEQWSKDIGAVKSYQQLVILPLLITEAAKLTENPKNRNELVNNLKEHYKVVTGSDIKPEELAEGTFNLEEFFIGLKNNIIQKPLSAGSPQLQFIEAITPSGKITPESLTFSDKNFDAAYKLFNAALKQLKVTDITRVTAVKTGLEERNNGAISLREKLKKFDVELLQNPESALTNLNKLFTQAGQLVEFETSLSTDFAKSLPDIERGKILEQLDDELIKNRQAYADDFRRKLVTIQDRMGKTFKEMTALDEEIDSYKKPSEVF